MVDSIAERLDMQKQDVEKIMNAFIDEIKDRFRKGQRIEIHRFGSFYPHKKRARTVIIPSTGKKHITKAKTVLKFKTSKHISTGYREKL